MDLNREGWLTEVAKATSPYFGRFKLGPFRVTCGWPSRFALRSKATRVGECHASISSSSGHCEIFISPLLDKPLEVAGTLIHEMAHVAAGYKAQHGPDFVKVCRFVGLLQGKPTSVMPGKVLNEKLSRLVETLGAYPHAAIKPVAVKAVKVEKPKTGMALKCELCGCRISISLKWLERSGVPKCGCGGLMEESNRDNDKDGE